MYYTTILLIILLFLVPGPKHVYSLIQF